MTGAHPFQHSRHELISLLCTKTRPRGRINPKTCYYNATCPLPQSPDTPPLHTCPTVFKLRSEAESPQPIHLQAPMPTAGCAHMRDNVQHSQSHGLVEVDKISFLRERRQTMHVFIKAWFSLCLLSNHPEHGPLGIGDDRSMLLK